MRRTWLLLLILCLLPLTNARAGEEGTEPGTTSYTRAAHADDELALEVAVREMLPESGKGPHVWLVGAVHLADDSYYKALQEVLDDQPTVLYEGVMPPGAGHLRNEPPEAQVEDTHARLTFLARTAAAVLLHGQTLPPDYAGFVAAAAEVRPGLDNLLKRTSLDAWGRAILYEPDVEEGTFRFVSLGADGEPGGEGAAADLEAGPAAAATEENGVRQEPFNLQRKLADLLGLTYQGAGIDYGRKSWQPSDMGIDELRRAVAKRGGDFDKLEDMLAGRGLRGFFVRIAIGLIKVLDALSGGDVSLAVKATLVTELGTGPAEPQPDATLDRAMLDAIIGDRNHVVMEDLDRLLAAHPDLPSVAIFYGAAHMPDFERRLHERGYRPGPMRWLRAIDVDVSAGGAMFESMRRQLEERLKKGK